MISLSIVVPLHNAEATVRELASRCLLALESKGEVELVLVDDASSDGTPQILDELAADPRVEVLHLGARAGRFGATKAGLGAAKGSLVAVLDGARPVPPERLADLVDDLERTGSDVVFAAKPTRGESRWFRVGRWLYGLAQGPAPHAPPRGAVGALVLRAELAKRAARVGLKNANLPAVLVALGGRYATLPCDRTARVEGTPRAGAPGLAREALGSLALTGALTQWCLYSALLAYALAGIGFAVLAPEKAHVANVVLLYVAGGLIGVAALVHLSARYVLRSR